MNVILKYRLDWQPLFMKGGPPGRGAGEDFNSEKDGVFVVHVLYLGVVKVVLVLLSFFSLKSSKAGAFAVLFKVTEQKKV